MSEPLYTWTPAQFRAHDVLITHQRKDIGGCICGWGVNTGHLGRSHAEHVIDELGRAGIVLAESQSNPDVCVTCNPPHGRRPRRTSGPRRADEIAAEEIA